MFKVVFTKQATKTLQRLPRNQAKLIQEKLESIAHAPSQQHNNVTKLQNQDGFRLRIGDLRVIYEIQDQQLVIIVLKIGSCGEVYRR